MGKSRRINKKYTAIITIAFILFSLISFSQEDKTISLRASFQGLGDLTGGEFISSAQGISSDGKVVTGYSASTTGKQAFRWTAEQGIISLGNLPDNSFNGLDLKGWTLQNAHGITPDGNIIVGNGINPDGNQEAFRVILDTLLNSAQNDSIDYLGQIPPGNTPEIFAPGILSTSAREHHGPAISPDGKEIYWSVRRVTTDTIYKTKLMFSRFINNSWTKSAEAPFSNVELEQPAFSPDGKNLFFLRSDSLVSGGVKLNIVSYTKTGDEWVNPVVICEGAFSSIAINGTVYYCGLSGNRITGIFKIVKKDGIYSEPEKLPEQINKPGTMNWTPYVAPDESYIIFSRLVPGGDYGELLISFKNNTNNWIDPLSLGQSINTSSQERQPVVSPDGKYLFFSRWISDNNEVIFWVSAGIIDLLKATLKNINEGDVKKNELNPSN